MTKGRKTGGRQKGTPNKLKSGPNEALERLNCKPEEFLAFTMMNTLPCAHCTLSTRGECETCSGTGYEKVPLQTRVNAAKDLMPFIHPKLASKTVATTTRRVVLARMNHLSQEDQNGLSEFLSNAKINGVLDN